MSYCLKFLLVLLLFAKREVDLAILVRKFVYQKDMSEYCRRRVVPSVFLGRQVVDAYSQILHFSRLELPYSCFVSIRTESGSNIILVINLMSDKNLIDACNESKNQLLVYEIGETFGGYWGALPDNMIKAQPHTEENNVYTLKTTQPTTTTTATMKRTTTRTTTPSTTEDLETASKMSPKRVDEIVVEVPLVNVSAVLLPSGLSGNNLFDVDEPFDTVIDAKPRPGVSYKTKVLPLVQFAISDEVSGRRSSDTKEAVAPRYEVDLNADLFTPDARSQPSHKEVTFDTHPNNVFPRPGFIDSSSRRETEHISNPYEIVDAILKNLSKTKDVNPKNNVKIDKDVENLLQGLAKIGHNESGFLVPNASWYTRRPASTAHRISNKYRTDSITWRQPSASYRTNYLEEEEDTSTMEGSSQDANKSSNSMQTMNNNDSVIIDVEKSGLLLPPALDVDRVLLNGFLVPNASWYTRRPTSTAHRISNKYRTDSITWRQPSASYRTNYLEEEETSTVEGSSQDATKSSNSMQTMNNNDSVIIDVEKSGPLLPPALDVDRVLLNVTQQSNEMEKSTIGNPETLASEVSGITTTATTLEILRPMTLVDHESWENMVQAASLMAVVLNQSITSGVDEKQQGLNVTLLPPGAPGDVKRRKKRYIHAIPIEFVKPHHLPANIEVPSSTVHTDKIADMQEFQRLIELQDDEVHDRVALRYLRQYVGPVLFNICDFEEATSKHVFLFNSSRLVLAISNFTLERMTLVMTPARTLLTSDARCATAHLECQVSGARVCIDSLCACDGVPNCGQNDIYDEDRLSCGGSAGLQHNVCLAAITFLAVLLTILYTVHYWLKRCVPKVSDAFFIYTDAAENILYLDTIMRSPHDTDDPKDMLRSASLQRYMECTDMEIKTKKTVCSFIDRFCQTLKCKRKEKQSQSLGDEQYDAMDTAGDRRRFYSFAEVELGKMGSPFKVDAAVQTGSSFEIHLMNKPLTKERITNEDSDSEDIMTHYVGKLESMDRKSFLDLGKEISDELSILNFFRRARSISMQMSELRAVKCAETQAEYTPTLNTEEKEIECHEYDRSMISQVTESVTATTAETSDKKPESLVKKLRFETERTTIHVSDDDVVEEDTDGNAPDQRHGYRRSVVYGGSKNFHFDETDPNSNVAEPSTSTGNREFKSYFWGSSKNKPKKPTKKKSQQLNIR